MDMCSSCVPMLQVFSVAMTVPTHANFVELMTGWVFAPRRTVLGMLRAGGTERHHSAVHRMFAQAKWSVDKVGLAVFDLIRKLVPQETVFLAGDDTLLNRQGLKIFGTGMHRDPMLSSHSFTVVRWGHCWVVLCVIIESPRSKGRYFALPILARLYLSKTAAKKWKRTYRTTPDLMLQMLERVHAHDRQQSLHFPGDSASMLSRMPVDIDVTGRVLCNSRIHGPLPVAPQGQRGRKRVRGERLATPAEQT